MTVFYERDAESGEFALLDRDTREVRKLFPQRKALADVALRKMQPVIIPARDGLAASRLSDLARGRTPASGRLPMVLVIHGGPYPRDVWGFNSTHQWLANRGYAVLSVNYRGSTGFGKAFVTAADREWGGKMHDDLIDAVDWAVAQGIADPKRVGFLGGSYGGYSALTAATKTPEVFACIVDVFGISNLITFMATIPPYWGPWFSVWKNRLGDPDTEAGRAFLIERSPLTHIDRVVRPILIGQGMRDVRVVAAESEQMVAALKQRRHSRHLRHLRRRGPRLCPAGKPARLERRHRSLPGQASRRPLPAARQRSRRLVAQGGNRRRTGAGAFGVGRGWWDCAFSCGSHGLHSAGTCAWPLARSLEERSHALRSAKCAPQNAIAAPRHSAARPASTPEIVGSGLGAEAAWPAPASTSTPTAIRNWRIRGGICPDTALSISVAVK